MKVLVYLFYAFAGIVFSQSSLAAGSRDCSSVKVDCISHKIIIERSGQSPYEETINCGKDGTTPTTKGTVGGPHKGTIVPNGVDIQAPGMGQDGGGKVFHLPNPKPTSGAYWGTGTPDGSDSTKGCIAVSEKIIQVLNLCKGAPLDIKGNGSGGSKRGGGSGRGGTGSTRGSGT